MSTATASTPPAPEPTTELSQGPGGFGDESHAPATFDVYGGQPALLLALLAAVGVSEDGAP